jgi:hypothetical protein
MTGECPSKPATWDEEVLLVFLIKNLQPIRGRQSHLEARRCPGYPPSGSPDVELGIRVAIMRLRGRAATHDLALIVARGTRIGSEWAHG